MKSYSMNFEFLTKRPLTEDELGLLQSQVMAQIEEPTDGEGNDADYTTCLIRSLIKENK